MCRLTSYRTFGVCRTPSTALRGAIDRRAPRGAPCKRASSASTEHLERSVERHEARLDHERRLARGHLLAEFGQRFAMGFGLDLRIGDARCAIGDTGRTAVAVIDRDQLRDMVQLY